MSAAEHGLRRRGAQPIPRRPWLLVIASLLLAALALWTGVQYRRSAGREQRLRAEIKQAYAEAETLRSTAVQWRERAMLLQGQVSALTVERDGLAKELAALKARRGNRGPARR